MVQLITDRKQQHIELLKRLRKKRWADMTASERTAWYGEATKGAYNYTDLNRVENAVAEIAALAGLSLTTKTNWTVWDTPVSSDMSRYLNNVARIRSYCATLGSVSNFPTLPSTMSGLTLESANNIEKVLELAYEVVKNSIRPGSELGEFKLGVSTLGGI